MFRSYFFAPLLILSTQAFSQKDASLSSGLAKQQEGNHQQAISDFSESISKNAAEVQAYIKKWDEAMKFTEFERAEKGIELPKIEAALAKPYHARGVSNAAIFKNEAALSDLNTAIKMDPKFARSYYERGKVLWSMGKKFEGCSDLGTAKVMGDSIAKDLYEERFCWSEAITFYKDAISKLRLNQHEEAMDFIQKAIRICPDSASFYAVRGKCYTGMGKLDLAFPDFDKAISASANNAEAYFGRGMAFMEKRKFQEAFNDFDKAIKINERYADAYLNRAYACERMNKIQSALYDYLQVQRLKPNDPLAFFKSALLKDTNGDKNGACLDFKKAASLNHSEAADYAKDCK